MAGQTVPPISDNLSAQFHQHSFVAGEAAGAVPGARNNVQDVQDPSHNAKNTR